MSNDDGIVIEALWDSYRHKIGVLGCSGGLMMSSLEAMSAWMKLKALRESLESRGETVPEITDQWVLAVLERRHDDPPKHYGVMMGDGLMMETVALEDEEIVEGM